MACSSRRRRAGLVRSREVLSAGLLVVFAIASVGARAEEHPKVVLKGSPNMAANPSSTLASFTQGSSSQASATGVGPGSIAPQMKVLSLRPASRAASRAASDEGNPGQNVFRPAGNLSVASSQGGIDVKAMQPGPTGSQNATSMKREQAQPLPK